MNKLKAVTVGGFPVKMDDFAWMADGIIEAIKGLTSSYGVAANEVIILSGCKKTTISTTTTIAEGFVMWEGEVYYVPEHSFSSLPSHTHRIYWKLETSFNTSGLKTFQDSTVHDTYEITVALCHMTPIDLSLVEYKDAKTIYEVINQNIDGFPVGGICMWSGDPGALPVGWSLCDGTGTTPDLRGRFVIGYDPRTTDPSNGIWDSNYTDIGNVGGEKQHTLNTASLPTHSHKVLEVEVQSGTGITVLADGTGTGLTGNVDHMTLNRPHENRPPYYVLAYIMKTASQVNSTLPGYL